MNDKNVKISVVIPTYNKADILPMAIESVLAQTHKNVEILIVDDGSTDNTEDVVTRYDSHVEYIRMNSNGGGPARPRNVGLRAASGDYIAFLDSDDLMLPAKLSEQADFLNAYRDMPLVFSDFRTYRTADDDEPNFLADHTDFQAMPKIPLRNNWYRVTSSLAYETLIPDTYIRPSSVMFRKSVVDDVGYFDETLSYSDDIDFFFRVARRFDIGFINSPLHIRQLNTGKAVSRANILENRLRVYSKQRNIPKSPKATRDLDFYLSKVLFSLGYVQRKRGERARALGYYLRSWRMNPLNARIVISMLRAAFSR